MTTLRRSALTVVCVAAAVFIVLVAVSAPRHDVKTWLDLAGVLTLTIGFAAIGAFLAARRPEQVIGWLLLGFGAVFAVKLAAEEVAQWAWLQHLDGTARTAVLVNNLADPLWWALLLTVTIVFPSGHLPGRTWRRGLIVAYVLLGLALATAPFSRYYGRVPVPAPIAGIEQVPFYAFPFLFFPIFVLAIAALMRLVLLSFRGDPVERRQVRWVGLAVAVILLSLVVAAWVPGANVISGIAAGVGLPIAIAIAITRHRLYDIDRIVSRTVTYAVVIGVLAAVFLIVAVVPTLVLGSAETPSWLVAGSTLVAFSLFNPLRRRVQRAVDRRFNRLPYDPENIAEVLGSRLRDEVDQTRIIDALIAASVVAFDPAMAGTWTKDSR